MKLKFTFSAANQLRALGRTARLNRRGEKTALARQPCLTIRTPCRVQADRFPGLVEPWQKVGQPVRIVNIQIRDMEKDLKKCCHLQ